MEEKIMVFLHGGTGSLSAWNLIKPYLDKVKGTKIFIDLRGHGKSFRPTNWRDYRLEKHAEDILRVINSRRLKKVILIGHCLGAMVAATCSVRYPKRVDKLILINPGINRGTPIFNNLTRYCISFIVRFLELLNAEMPPPVGKRIDYARFRNTSDISFRRILADWRYMKLPAVFFQAMAFLDWDYERVYRRIKTPTLIIAGKKDIIFNLSVTQRIKDLIQGSKLHIINSNHISIINNPKEVAEKIALFLR